MKSIYTLAAVAMIATVGSAQAQTPGPCTANMAANAAIISRAQAATTPTGRLAVLKAAIAANPSNAACLVDLALQMGLANVNPAGGPEDFVAGAVPTTTDGVTPPAENPNQLNQPAATVGASPASPSI